MANIITKINLNETEYNLKDTEARNRIAELNLQIVNNANIDLYSYGVEWDTTNSTPECVRIGNPLLHKSLPIQSAYRGCIAKGNEVVYYLDPNDWHFKLDEEGNVISETITGVTIAVNDGIVTLTLPEGKSLDNGVYVKISTFWGQIIKTELSTTVLFETILTEEEKTSLAGITSITVGANLSGYDGTVRVHIPKFYGRSGENGTKKWVRISTVKIDDTWMEIPEMLIDAYRCTLLRTETNGWGYLDSLPKNSTVSIVNTQSFCRGGNRDLTGSNDSYLSTDLNRTHLGKPITNITRANMRTYAKSVNSELLCYEFYKWIFCWAYIIEYANFNSQANYISELTSDGYHQGGLGNGVTNYNWDLWEFYNSNNPITPCGYCNLFGNFSGIKDGIKPVKFDISLWVKNYTLNENAITSTISSNGRKITSIKTATYAFTGSSTLIWGNTTYTISGLSEGLTVIFKEGDDYSTAASITPTIKNNTYTVSWSEYELGKNRYIGFSEALETCNITISNNKRTSHERTDTWNSLIVSRWRGFDNPFGDIWTNLDGIVLKRDTAGTDSTVYTTTEIANFDDTINNKKEAGAEKAIDGWIKEFDLGIHAEIIPSLIGGNETTYKCDYHWCNINNVELRLLRVGGRAADGGRAGFLSFASSNGVGGRGSDVGFRTLTRK